MPTSLITNVRTAADLLVGGDIVAFPTETVYGLGANALDVAAVARIFEAKQRPAFDPLIVHVGNTEAISDVVQEMPPTARRLAERFWPGPLTLVLPKHEQIPDLVTSGLPGVGIRIPQHPIALQLLKAAGCPLAAPSANPFGGISPTTAQHVLQGLAGRIDAVLDGGPCAVGLESTVLSLMERKPLVLRLGGLPLEAIAEVVGELDVATASSSQPDAAQPAPGMLSRHYAPQAGLVLVPADAQIPPPTNRSALLTWGPGGESDDRFVAVQRLSDTADMAECAANFFAGLRSLDAHNPDVIIARRFPDYGLGRALNDRLERASR